MTPFADVWIIKLMFMNLLWKFTYAQCSLNADQLQLTDWKGEITSPGFKEGQYPQNEACVWSVRLSQGSRVRLVFEEFDLDPGIREREDTQNKCQDYVQVLEGQRDSGKEMGRYCGGTTPPPLVSKTNEVTVIFVSDGRGGKRGFRLSYSGSCENMNVTRSNTILESPNYPMEPPTGVRCEWWVTVPENMYPLVKLIDFVTNSTKCDRAIINLYGSFDDDSNWICEDRKDPVKFSGNKMIIEYTKKPAFPPAVFSLNVSFVDKCASDSCENGGICEEEMFGIVCKCAGKFHGARCELKLMSCDDKPCSNGAECIQTDDEIICECTPGYAGETCEVKISECEPNPCLQGGSCSEKGTDYTCSCPEGFAGKNCENPVSQCQVDPCMNGGSCQGFRNGFICLCPDGYTGETCQDKLNTCDETNCIQGVCRGSPDGPICECKTGFSGKRCDVNLNDCKTSPCNKGATCVDEDDGFSCICPPGLTGERCFSELGECSQMPCKNSGTCENLDPGFRCKCSSGFTGRICEIEVQGCDPNPCKGDAKCVQLPGGFQCDCPPGFVGKLCDSSLNPCASDPCKNDAPCVATTSQLGADYVCECPLGYDGEQCEREINECDPNPCLNGGVCKDMLNDFLCQCSRGYRGKVCNIRTDTCASGPCRNNARCVEKTGEYECVCGPGFSGQLCEVDENECSSNPCLNNGTCLDRGGFFDCVCKDGFQGGMCQVNINDCQGEICQNGGVCVDMINDFRCKCSSDFGGKRCENFLYKDSPHCAGEEDENGIYWFSSRAESKEKQPCPPGIIGEATRCCKRNDQSRTGGVWSDPDLRECVNPVLIHIAQDVQRLLTNDNVNEREAMEATIRLVNATSLHHGSTIYPGDLATSSDALGALAYAIEKISLSDGGLHNFAQVYADAVENIIDPDTEEIWRKVKDVEFVEDKLTNVIDSVEILAENLSAKLSKSLKRRKRGLYDTVESTAISVVKKNTEFRIKISDSDNSYNLRIYKDQSLTNSIELPRSLLTMAEESSQGPIGVYNGRFSSIAGLLTPRCPSHNRTTNKTGSSVLNSDIIAAKILGVPDKTYDDLYDPVIITFELKNPSLTKVPRPLCSFLNVSSRSTTTRWPQTGCDVFYQNFSHVVCHCYHLTNFAVLMDVYGISGHLDVVHQKTLSFISYIGGTLSILGCILAIAVFEYFRLKSDRVRIHEQLAISIVLVQFIFLVGIDRKENQEVCKVFAILLHYSLLAMFCWMLVEGIHLYVILVKVFKKGSHLKKYMVIGWGIPLVIVAVSVGVFYDDYGQGEMCWMTNFMLLVLFVPIATVVILLNVFVLVVVVRVMMKSFAISGKTNSEEASSVRITLKAAAVLLPLLGLTWSFCFLSFDTGATLLFTYMFTLFNCLQGVLFFVFHCLLNIDVRKAFERRYKRTKQTSVNNVNVDRRHVNRRKSSLTTTDSDPFADTGHLNGSSLSYRSSTKSDDTEFSELSYYSKQSLSETRSSPINNLSSTVTDGNIFLPPFATAESTMTHLPRST